MGASRPAAVHPPGEGELFTIEVRADDAAIVLVLRGELDLAGRPRLRAALEAALSAGHEQIVLELSGLAFIDGSSIGVIESARGRLRARGGTLTLRDAQPQVRRGIEHCASLSRRDEEVAPVRASRAGLPWSGAAAVGP
jgi:anti-anti-sigma factor